MCQEHFFAVRNLKSATAKGLHESLTTAMEYMRVTDWKKKMIGFGCDGANTNMGQQRGLRGLLQGEAPWVFVFWCLAHRLELSIKDALKATYFTNIDELLLRLYYVYEKSPKKCRELETVAAELQSCLEESDLPRGRGVRPLRACGTRFIAHKVNALDRVINRFGVYISHLIALTEDSSVRPADRDKLKGYVKKWQYSKVLFGCALFHDMLKSFSVLSQRLQGDELCVVRAIDSVMKTKATMDKLKAKPFHDFPSVAKVLDRVKHEEDGHYYQGIQLKDYDNGLQYLRSHYTEWVVALEECLRHRLQFQDTELLTHAVTILATYGWARCESPDFAYESLDVICQRFEVPLTSASVCLSVIREEWDDMVLYAKKYLDLVQEDYKAIWWKLFNFVDSKEWSNVLAIVELLFCLPMSNGRLERLFSEMKLIKSNRRNRLNEDTLDQLLRIKVEGPPLSEWDASHAVELWTQDRVRRVNQPDLQQRTGGTQQSHEASPDDPLLLDDWEEWVMEP